MDTQRNDDRLIDDGHIGQAVRLDAAGALERLRAGNQAFLSANANDGDVSSATVKRLFEDGQAPFACVVSCADSRVVPEHIFMAGLGELFCIRVAGNVIGDMERASCVYAAEHLGVQLIVVLGHTNCGAIEAAMGAAGGDALDVDHPITPLVSSIVEVIGSQTDPHAASIANTKAGVEALAGDSVLAHLASESGLEIRGALYHTDSGEVEFL